jgi:hypothetical protein
VMRRKCPVGGWALVAIPTAACCTFLRSATALAEGACVLSVGADGVDERWTAELEAIKAALAHRDDVDGCASIVLAGAANGVRVTVVLKDGRATERTLTDSRDLRAVVAALVLLPASATADAATAQEEAASAALDIVRPPAPVVDREIRAERDQAPSAPTLMPSNQRGTRVDLGGRAGARWSGAAPAGTLGVFADVRLGDWVLDAHGRWDSYAVASGLVDYTTHAFEIGGNIGRDFRVGPTSLTLLAGPSFVTLWQTLQSTPPTVYVSGVNPKTGHPIASVTPSARDGQVLRLASAARWSFVSRRPMTVFLEADAEVDATRDAGDSMPASAAATGPIPIWSAGLSVGGAVAVWP